jgi:CubicO group peptidase (beta-lactamase class C family)
MRKKTSSMARRQFLTVLGTASAATVLQAADSTTISAAPASNTSTNKPPAPQLPKNLNEVIEPIRATGKVPGLAAAVIVEGKLAGVGAVGIRKAGNPIRVKGTDLWHIGSCTKPMTATLIAMFVERRKMSWDMTISDALPSLRDTMNPAYREVTLEELLSHRAGLPAQADTKLWEEAWSQHGSPAEQRYEFAKGTLSKEPAEPPGTKYVYSNQGYAVAGAMLEKITNQPWETLMRDNLFRPLMMTLSGFGVPGTIGQVDQPWGHKWKGGKLEPQQTDNPPAIAPGAAVHCAIYDFARFALLHLNGASGEPRLLKRETYEKLHTPHAGQEYSLGWNRQDRNWAKGWTLNHNGSNTLNFATIWIAPKIKFAAVAATNIGGDSGEKVTDEAIQALIKKFVIS